MGKKKLIVISLFLFCSTSFFFSEDFNWSSCLHNYGGGFEEGDEVLSFNTGYDWDYMTFFEHGWSLPEFTFEYQKNIKINDLPLSFGGFVMFSATKQIHVNNDIEWKDTYLRGGGEVAYHFKFPLKILDVFSIFRLGFSFDFKNETETFLNEKNVTKNTDFWMIMSFGVGASFTINDRYALLTEIGFPFNKIGLQMKL